MERGVDLLIESEVTAALVCMVETRILNRRTYSVLLLKIS
jgi:hypothetical protein